MSMQLIALLNSAADAWAAWMWPMTWHVSVLVLVVAAITWLLRGRSARLRYALWLLVPIRLLLPPTLALATGWGWWLLPSADHVDVPQQTLHARHEFVAGRSGSAAEEVQPGPAEHREFARAEPWAAATGNTPSNESLEFRPAPVMAQAKLSLRGWLFCGWLLGVGLLTLRLLFGCFNAAKLVRQSQDISPACGVGKRQAAADAVGAGELLETCRRRMGIRRAVRLCQLADARVPMLIGLIQPTIILPTALDKRLTTRELEAVLVHELQHVARHDAIVHFGQSLLGIVYFFHPLVWLTNRLLNLLREDACDEATVAVLAGQRRDYGAGIVKVAELMSGPMPGMSLGIVESGGQVKRRLHRILDPRLPVGRRLSWSAIVLLVLFAAVVLPVAARPNHSTATELAASAAATAEPSVEDQSTIRGTVVGENDAPVEGARVFTQWVVHNRSLLVETRTSSDGQFELAVPLKVERNEYSPLVLASLDSGRLQAQSQIPGNIVAARAGDIRLKLAPARRIELLVIDGEMHPLAAAKAGILSDEHLLGIGQTDLDGRASFFVPRDTGNLCIFALKEGHGVDYRAFLSPREIAGDQKTQSSPLPEGPVRLTLDGAIPLRVRGVTADGAPIAGLDLYPWYAKRADQPTELNFSFCPEVVQAKTDEDGFASFDWIPHWQRGALGFWPISDDYESQRAEYNPTTGDGTLTMRLHRLVPMRGRVTSPSGLPAPGIHVVANGRGYGIDDFDGAARTDADGRYEIKTAPNRAYLVIVEDKQWAAAPRTGFVVRPKSPIDGIDFTLRPATRVFGRAAPGLDRQPIKGQRMYVEQRGQKASKLAGAQLPNPQQFNGEIQPSINHSAQLGDNGQFEFFLGPGHFVVQNDRRTEFEIKTQREKELSLDGGAVVSTADATERDRIIAQLRDRGATIADGGPAGGLTIELKGAQAGDERAPAPPEAPDDTLHKTVRVVNELGEPVVGAMVTPWAIRTVQGGHGRWQPKGLGDSEPPILTTDADGKATIPFPRFAQKDERTPPRELTCRVRHANYTETSQSDVSVIPEDLETVATIVLQAGAVVEVTALDGDRPLAADRVRALWSGPWGAGAKVNAAGRLELPPLAAGTELLRLVYVPEQGPMQVSDIETLKLTNGERRELRIEVKPTVRVEGQLDLVVPRPVKNGRIVANIIERANGDSATLYWEATAAINEDGTFVLKELPHGDLQVIALCDGFVAKAGIAPAITRSGRRATSVPGSPQVFHLSDATNEIVIKMVRTASCRFRVLGPDGLPVAGANCGFWPNVHWWDGGAQMYGEAGGSTAEALRNPNSQKQVWKQDDLQFAATTDADGIAVVENVPAEEAHFAVTHDDLELPIGDRNRRWGNVELKAGQTAEVTVELQKKGTQLIGSKTHKRAERPARIPYVPLAKEDDTAQAEYAALAEEYQTIRSRERANTDRRAGAAESRPQPKDFAPRFFALAAKHPDDPAAVDSLTWIARHGVFGEEAEQALQILTSKYSRSDQLKAYVGTSSIYGEPFEPYEAFLRAVLQDNPNRNIQGAACATLATYLKMAVENSQRKLVEMAIDGEQSSVRGVKLANLNRLKERGLDNVAAESEALFERAIKDYPDVKLEHAVPQEVEAFAQEQLFGLRNLAIGKPALDIEGTDISGAALKLSDYRGKVVVLEFGSHRTCGICKALYPQLRSLVERFEAQPFALIGVNLNDDLAELKELAATKETTWRVLWDGDADRGPIASRWAIRGLPTVYVLDAAGVIRNKGFLQGDELAGTVEMLLKEMSVKPEIATKGGKESKLKTAATATAPTNLPNVIPNDIIAQLHKRGATITDGGPAGGPTIELKGAQADDAAVDLLPQIGSVWELTLGPGKFTTASFDSIAKLTDLRRLNLRNVKITAADTEKLGRLPHLAALGFQCPLDDEALRPLKDFPALAGLYFWAPNQISGAGVASIAAISGLNQLQLVSDTVEDEGLKALAGCQKLSQLWLGGKRITGEGLKYLAECPNLTTLTLSTPNLRAESLRYLKSAAHLDNLNLEGCPQFGDDAVAILGEEVKLRFLSLGGAKITDAGLAPLNQLVDLKALRLMNTQVAGHGLAALTDLTKLTNLDVDGEATTNKVFAHLHQFPTLRAVSIGSGSPDKLDKITDEGLAHIGKALNLSLISFRGSGITDQGLSALGTLPNLTDVSFYWTPGVSKTHWHPQAP